MQRGVVVRESMRLRVQGWSDIVGGFRGFKGLGFRILGGCPNFSGHFVGLVMLCHLVFMRSSHTGSPVAAEFMVYLHSTVKECLGQG